MYTDEHIQQLEQVWQTSSRWSGIQRPYSAEEVVRLRGSISVDHTLARLGAEKLWNLFETQPYVHALGAVTGNQAVQQVQAGLKAIYLSGWQVAADNNDAFETYPDQSLYPILSAPNLIKRINKALIRADQITHMKNENMDWFAPIVADAEAGFGGVLNAFELTKAMIEAGVAAVHFEDQLSSLKKCGHMGGKVLVAVEPYIRKLVSARLASDVMGVPTIIIGRTDAATAKLIRYDSGNFEDRFLTGKQSPEGYYYVSGGVEYAIERALQFAPYCDMVWCETGKPDIGEAREFAQAIHEKFPGKWLAYNCSPSFNWRKHLDAKTINNFQQSLGEMGYKFQFVTLAGFHTLNASMYELAERYAVNGMAAYADFQEHEFELEKNGSFKAIKHQQFVGAGYFDEVTMAISEGQSSTSAMEGSTEQEQFH